MAIFNTPVNVSTGTNLTASLWNDQLGANGSVKYLYDNTISRNVILRKSTNTVLALGGNADIAFDTIVTTYTNDQLNFPITTPVTNIPLPTMGMYLATFTMRYSVASNITVRFITTDGAIAIAHQNQLAYLANGNITTTAILTSNSNTCAVTVNVLSSAAGTITAAAPTGTVDGSMMLRIVQLNTGL